MYIFIYLLVIKSLKDLTKKPTFADSALCDKITNKCHTNLHIGL